MKRDVAVLGFIIGFIMPLLGMVVIFLIKFSGESFSGFLEALFNNKKVAATVISLSALANIIPFIYYTNRRLDLTAKGILIATMLYGVLFILLKFVW